MKKLHQPRKIGRKRITLGRAILVLGLLVSAVWAWSAWGFPRAIIGLANVGVRRGVLHVHYPDTSQGYNGAGNAVFYEDTATRGFPAPPALQLFSTDSTLAAWIRFAKTRDLMLTAVLWPLPAALLGTGALLLWQGLQARRRAPRNVCAHCGYDLAATPSASPCPECGKRAINT